MEATDDSVERLTRELSEALKECSGGTLMAVVYPASGRKNISLKPIRQWER